MDNSSFKKLFKYINVLHKNCRWPDSNPRHLVSKVTTLSTVPQKLPSMRGFLMYLISDVLPLSTVPQPLPNMRGF